MDLITELLRFDPAKRPSASQALQHDFFKGPKMSIKLVKSSNLSSEPKPPQAKATQISQNEKMQDDEAQSIQVRTYDQKQTEKPKKTVNPVQIPASNMKDPDEIDDIFDGILF